MKRIVSVIGICVCALAYAGSTVTIPLTYKNVESLTESADDPGSSTVDPVDPNQARVELTGNTLNIYEGLEGNAHISLYNMTSPHVVLQTFFDESVTVTLTDTAQYSILLSNPNLGVVYGTFRYPVDQTRKVMQEGRLYILLGNHSYSLSGVKIQ